MARIDSNVRALSDDRPTHATPGGERASGHDLLCFSHLRWGFVFQRPQHLLSRLARRRRVFFFEEPVQADEGFDGARARLEIKTSPEGVVVAVPHLSAAVFHDRTASYEAQRRLLAGLIEGQGIRDYDAWYYTPMALAFTGELRPHVTIFDCMDELSAFRGAPPELLARERELLGRADLVFTGGQSLFEAKKDRHPHVHCFPSSVDAAHFRKARQPHAQPADQAALPAGPKLGFAGVIDERMDLELVDAVAAARPDWQLVMLGPVVKVDPASLPRRPNLHWLGMKSYADLPAYFASWSVGLLPFARNEATRFISPTKTPEYLAAGLPVVSTSIRDVIRPYGDLGLAYIADEPSQFVNAVERALARDKSALHAEADSFLARGSWDATADRMHHLAVETLRRKRTSPNEGQSQATTSGM